MSDAISLFHAGSLNTVLTQDILPAFTQATGYTVVNTPGPAVGLANRIRQAETPPDMYMSADAETNRVLMGTENGDIVRWFCVMAGMRMVLIYSPHSRFKAELEAAASGGQPWYKVLQSPGFVLKRADPRTDPGGYRAIFVLQLAERFYQQPGLKDCILQGDENEDQILSRYTNGLEDGSTDAMLMYVTGALDWSLPHIHLPDAVDLSNPALADHYRTASYTNPHGQTFHGTPAMYSLTIPMAARHQAGAEALAAFVLSDSGRAALANRGFLPAPRLVGGASAAVPAALRGLVDGVYA